MFVCVDLIKLAIKYEYDLTKSIRRNCLVYRNITVVDRKTSDKRSLALWIDIKDTLKSSA